jgi:hypothetical protein
MARRISRGTPYVLTAGEIENLLGALTPRMEEQVAAMLDMTVEAWRKESKAKRAKHIVDYQNRGQFAAVMTAAAKAQTDMEGAAFAVTMQTEAQALSETVAELTELVHGLVKAGAK